LLVQYPEKLSAIEIVAKDEDGKIANNFPFNSDRLTKNTNCKVEAQKMQLACHSLPIDIAQAGKYQLEVTTVSKSRKPSTAPQLVKIEILPKTTKIVSFTLNNSDTGSIIVREGENLTLNWQVDGENNIQVELNPFGTVEKSGTKQIPVTPALPSQISLIVTDKYGKKVNKGFSIKVEANTTPSPTPSVPDLNQPPSSTSPVPDRQKPTTKPSKDLSI
jgi:hypothetical protein